MSLSIDIENLKFSYGRESILDISSLKIKVGEKIFIYGPSGSGKSTLLNVMAGVLKPSSGRVKVLNSCLENLKTAERDIFRGNHIGFIFQDFNLIPYLTIVENIILPLKTSRKKREFTETKILSEVKRLAQHLGISEFLDKRVSDLSIGQQQRVAVARALMGSPEVIIADEPTSSLDDAVTEKFIKLLLEEHEKNNFTLIFVSHDRRLAKYFERDLSLLELNKGGQ